MSRVLDRNGVQLTRGVRVSQLLPPGDGGTREGVVVATVGARVLVKWDGGSDDEMIDAASLTAVSAISERRRRP